MPEPLFEQEQNNPTYEDYVARVNYASETNGVQFHLSHDLEQDCWYMVVTQEDGHYGNWQRVLQRPVTKEEAAAFLALRRGEQR
jgi:RNA binding exosome subunit